MNAAQTKILSCSKCGAKNRVDAGRLSDAVCGRCKSPLKAAAGPVIVTDLNFAEIVENSSLPVLVDFWAAWCGPCRMVAPIVDELARELVGKVLVGKLDVDANQGTADRFAVQSIPSMLIFNKGKEAGRLVGAQPKGAILQKLQPFL